MLFFKTYFVFNEHFQASIPNEMERKTWLSGGETTMTQNILDIFL